MQQTSIVALSAAQVCAVTCSPVAKVHAHSHARTAGWGFPTLGNPAPHAWRAVYPPGAGPSHLAYPCGSGHCDHGHCWHIACGHNCPTRQANHCHAASAPPVGCASAATTQPAQPCCRRSRAAVASALPTEPLNRRSLATAASAVPCHRGQYAGIPPRSRAPHRPGMGCVLACPPNGVLPALQRGSSRDASRAVVALALGGGGGAGGRATGGGRRRASWPPRPAR